MESTGNVVGSEANVAQSKAELAGEDPLSSKRPTESGLAPVSESAAGLGSHDQRTEEAPPAPSTQLHEANNNNKPPASGAIGGGMGTVASSRDKMAGLSPSNTNLAKSMRGGMAASHPPEPTNVFQPVNNDLMGFNPNAKQARRIISEDPEWNLSSVPKLSDICVKAIVTHFQKHPLLHGIAPVFREKILSSISVDLPLSITAPLIPDETYWKRCSLAKFKNCDPSRHQDSWKQLYFERYIQGVIEQFVPWRDDEKDLWEKLMLAAPFVKTLVVDQLKPMEIEGGEEKLHPNQPNPDHLDMKMIMTCLQQLQDLSLYYGVRNCGMDFSWRSLGMTLGDSKSLASALKLTTTLKHLTIRSSYIDDSRIRVLASSFLDNKMLTKLDVSHNNIGDAGARGLSKWLASPTCNLTLLNVTNNQIGEAGAYALGMALTKNQRLLELHMGLNMMGDGGGVKLFTLLIKNHTLAKLNVCSNMLGEESVKMMAMWIYGSTSLTHLDMSCNKFDVKKVGKGMDSEVGKMMYQAVKQNKSLLEFHIQMTDFESSVVEAIHSVLHNHRQEHG